MKLLQQIKQKGKERLNQSRRKQQLLLLLEPWPPGETRSNHYYSKEKKGEEKAKEVGEKKYETWKVWILSINSWIDVTLEISRQLSKSHIDT